MTRRPDEHPLTFGQLSVWQIMRSYPLDRWSETYLRATVPLPATTPLSRVPDALDELCSRHESLRTRFAETPTGPVQRIAPVGGPAAVPVLTATVEQAVPAHAADEIARPRIDRATEFGHRFAIVTDRGRPTHVALVVDHIVADGYGLRRLCAELSVLLGGDSADGTRWLAEHPPQPRELAAEQRSEVGRRRHDAAEKHWRELMRTLPADLFPLPESAGETAGRVEAILRSPHTSPALATLAARTAVSPQNLLLALTALATSEVTQRSEVVLTLQAGNRYSPRWRSIVSSMNQYAPLALDIGPNSASFADFAAGIQRSALRAYRLGSYDIVAITNLVQRERDIALGFDHFYNYMALGITPAPAHSPPSSYEPGTITEEPSPHRQIGPRLDIKVRNGPDVPVVIRADPRLLPPPALRALLSWYDRQLHRLAYGSAQTVGEIRRSCRHALAHRTAA
ncbi:condensation domain-containing protein [Streptomyces sp. CAU 1734]|uniref:condensation domain-containing protein n=1 Tax=Streptomyces sp. CAU 1734 TaxID=3140360 RepID=UPI003261BB4E